MREPVKQLLTQIGAKKGAAMTRACLSVKFISLRQFPCFTFCIIMSFRKPCHMTFRKFIPSFTLTVPVVPSKTIPVQCFQTCKACLHSTVLFRSSYASYGLHVNPSHNAMPKGGKIGRKQSALKQNCHKKKSKFKGVQKQKKVSMELARNAATEITFVGTPPAASASLRKIGAELHRKLFP